MAGDIDQFLDVLVPGETLQRREAALAGDDLEPAALCGADLQVLQQAVRLDAGGQFRDAGCGTGLADIGGGGDQLRKRDHVDVHDGSLSVGWGGSAAQRCTPARRRDRGVQAESGFAGNRLHGAEQSEGGGSWAEAAWSAPRGSAPKQLTAEAAAQRSPCRTRRKGALRFSVWQAAVVPSHDLDEFLGGDDLNSVIAAER